ncbi:MAG: HD domain-containing protein [Candidatus Omnitrophica bacterium]|nr:HD domain-containing protein [Candidatus Omnitrophota bacterium]
MYKKIDYKKELEQASKSMILVHEPETLIKMIVRMIVNKVQVSHAGILLHDFEKDTYVLTVSKGDKGLKIPTGFARMDADNPMISFFRQRQDKQLFDDGAFVYEQGEKALNSKILSKNQKDVLKKVLYQMEILDAVACIPSYFRNDLLGVLILGNKKNGKKFAQDELDFFVALASDVAMAIRNAQLFEALAAELDKKQRLFIHTTIALAAAIEAKDRYTHGHTARVTNISLEITRKLESRHKLTFDEKFFEHLHIASLLHDIGKIGIPESILNKEGPLNETEAKRMQEHPLVGVNILQPIKELEDAILGVKYHHEKYDGSGYPEGLKGAQIPLIASIIAVADTFDAMTTDRPYRKALTKEEAVNEIKKQSGKQFNPQVAESFVELFQDNKI